MTNQEIYAAWKNLPTHSYQSTACLAQDLDIAISSLNEIISAEAKKDPNPLQAAPKTVEQKKVSSESIHTEEYSTVALIKEEAQPKLRHPQSRKRISLEQIEQILRLHGQGLSQREISSAMGISCNTISKYVNVNRDKDVSCSNNKHQKKKQATIDTKISVTDTMRVLDVLLDMAESFKEPVEVIGISANQEDSIASMVFKPSGDVFEITFRAVNKEKT